MNIYMVLAYDDYYPSGDNCRAVFLNKEDAEKFMNKIKDTDDWKYAHYEIVFKRAK